MEETSGPMEEAGGPRSRVPWKPLTRLRGRQRPVVLSTPVFPAESSWESYQRAQT